jgi:hypothetical protein
VNEESILNLTIEQLRYYLECEMDATYELHQRIDKAINFIQANYLKYQHRIDYKQHMQDYLNDVYKLLEILKGNEEE